MDPASGVHISDLYLTSSDYHNCKPSNRHLFHEPVPIMQLRDQLTSKLVSSSWKGLDAHGMNGVEPPFQKILVYAAAPKQNESLDRIDAPKSSRLNHASTHRKDMFVREAQRYLLEALKYLPMVLAFLVLPKTQSLFIRRLVHNTFRLSNTWGLMSTLCDSPQHVDEFRAICP